MGRHWSSKRVPRLFGEAFAEVLREVIPEVFIDRAVRRKHEWESCALLGILGCRRRNRQRHTQHAGQFLYATTMSAGITVKDVSLRIDAAGRSLVAVRVALGPRTANQKFALRSTSLDRLATAKTSDLENQTCR